MDYKRQHFLEEEIENLCDSNDLAHNHFLDSNFIYEYFNEIFLLRSYLRFFSIKIPYFML